MCFDGAICTATHQHLDMSAAALQANAQQLYVINGDGGIGVAFTYRNFTATSQYYGVALKGKYQSSELYSVSCVVMTTCMCIGAWHASLLCKTVSSQGCLCDICLLA
jgi:hypothetical protein